MSAQMDPVTAYNDRYSSAIDRGLNTVEVCVDDIGRLLVRYDYTPGDPGCLVGPADNWVEPSPDEIELISATVDGLPFSPTDQTVIDEILQAIEHENGRHWRPKYHRRAPCPGGLYAGSF